MTREDTYTDIGTRIYTLNYFKLYTLFSAPGWTYKENCDNSDEHVLKNKNSDPYKV